MDFFDKLGKKASETYKITAEKTGKIAQEAKLKMKMNENKSEIEDIYKDIGRKVYEKHVIDENINIKKELEEECTKIDILSAEIETYLEQVLSLKDKKQCINCASKIEKDFRFCPVCGEKQDEEKTEKLLENKIEKSEEIAKEKGEKIEKKTEETKTKKKNSK